jgi:superoxide dismutase
MHRGKYNPKITIEKQSKSHSKKHKAVIPKLNNYLKQSNLINKNKRASTIALRTQINENRGNQILNSKNSLENTNADQIEGLKILKRISEEVSHSSDQQIC